MTVPARPANAVVCTCPKGWHISFIARNRCPHRPDSPGIRAAVAADVKPKRTRRVR